MRSHGVQHAVFAINDREELPLLFTGVDLDAAHPPFAAAPTGIARSLTPWPHWTPSGDACVHPNAGPDGAKLRLPKFAMKPRLIPL